MNNSRKYLRIFFIFLLLIAGIVAALSWFVPVAQVVKRSVIINASADSVYDRLIKLENFNKWTVWSVHDSLEKPVLTGKDGTVGASEIWRGDEHISGEVQITIDSLFPGRRIVHLINFIQPRKATGRSVFMLQQVKEGTLLTWEFELSTPRPRNIFNLFYSLDKTMGKDFEDGLSLMKTSMEANNPVTIAKKYEPLPMNFPSTDLLMIRQQVRHDDIPSFFEQHFSLISAEIEKAKLAGGQPNGLFFGWDEKNEVADLGAAIPVPAGSKMDNPLMQVINLPASKALYVDYHGAYSGLPAVYNDIAKYISANHLTRKTPFIETYIKGPSNEKDTVQWQTRVVFLVE